MFRQREEQAQRPHRRTKLGGLENPKRRVSLAPSECGGGAGTVASWAGGRGPVGGVQWSHRNEDI